MTSKLKNRKTSKSVDNEKLALDSLFFPSYEEVTNEIRKKLGKRPHLPKGLPKGDWTEQSLKVLAERYLRKNDDGELIETPEEMCWRVAWDVASAEIRWGAKKRDVLRSAKEFYNLLITHEFLPNSPTLMNAGTGNGLQYSACFVLPVEDSLVGIFDAIKHQALIHQTGGGTGFAFSRLRPHGAVVKSSKGTASGPVSFMRIFDAATNEIKQGGKRRGANMGILRVDHPDILEFIHCKEEGGITNFNISVTITDAFMEAYEKDTDYDLIDPRDGKAVGKLNARRVFDEIAEGAWRTGDPGLVFIDRINKSTANPVPPLGPIESTNPCGEQPLYPYDSCNLGSIFLTYFVKEGQDDRGLPAVRQVDWEKLRKVTRLSVRFLDNVIEMNPYPLGAIRKISLAIRRIGLGVGGWADMLIYLGIPFDSDEALALGEEIMKVIQEEAIIETRKLARQRGAFPMFPVSIYKDEKPRRNSTVTTIAPTGSISIIAGASSGVEPIFAIAFQHIVKDRHLDRTLTFFNPKFEEIAKSRGFLTEEIKKKVAEHGVVRDIYEIPEDVRQIFGTAHEIHHDWHIKHQAVFQKYTENAVSKTINMTNNVTVDDIKNAYLLAWKTDCKGITVFRDGCKDAQVLNLGVNGKKQGKEVTFEEVWERPMVVSGSTYKIKTPVGTAFITVNHDAKGGPIEVFINVGKAGSDVQAMAEALGRVISKSLKFHSSLTSREKAEVIIDQLKGIGGRRSVGFGPNKILSLPDAIAMALATNLGLRVNGFLTSPLNGKVAEVFQNGNSASAHAMSNGSGVQSDLAGAVMSAQYPAQSGTEFSSGDDHTTALAESNLTSVKVGDQLTLSSTQIPRIAGDICPSCGASSFVYEEGCAKCFSCGYSEC
ncbi:ribonucleoside-diphosphate reductase, adenosylcobalamin-dependent [Candidatus Woesebacteria bacterium RIFCSPHIGHO2_01_FULL_39_32]|uniref:Vitamin B12-dependent ribonucleotide reductase n=1 Tax=Candidatus Woesebacteria bacterium RIFCSPLOWO2_01_FULL_39_25 TaxID=1802521 RepID=A0A1F8BIA5_9BACT|nr:MAG: ribonucleoside-diphosphate reductase, adenosylcobalamin-dependent [Candidatus Woesebacteria bacterium GWB1_37_5]OGM24488.1 MAG: ribonucleoside-diphosphate reductase, adenosylcobalamin-dependent [Candidatus Woesebacteria bacterium RIFCSPHIGHO2_01_FULL_39_32]OGM38881.1 MAG: ribonucleoside-diphosphate reductase, adenosylcobalamin-dependent [Candidatus Woesebacteria bacterium RIFCSPHIGHO2_12_FULL_38_11]OGM63794.1 MAG: ribonucleoside-diphosphate reductase, adenosylcobalamin-dependent [Candida